MDKFKGIDELVRALDKEKRLLSDMFQKRKSLAFRTEDARALTEYKEARLRYLINHGVIRETGDFLELEDVYLRFFEDVLSANEIINVAIVKEYIGKLNENMEFYLEEKDQRRRLKYIKEVRSTLKTISLTTLTNVIDLKRNVDNTYKTEPNINIKIKKLEKLDQKRLDIITMIKETEKLISEKQPVFFASANDDALTLTLHDVRIELNEAYHGLIDINKQIVLFLNMIRRQRQMLKKLHQLKYLRDQMTLEDKTDILKIANDSNPVWMEPQARYRTRPSLAMLKNDDSAKDILYKVMEQRKLPSSAKRKEAEPIPAEFFAQEQEQEKTVNQTEMYNAFEAQSDDLFNFLMNYNYDIEVSKEDRLLLFCQIAANYYDRLDISDTMQKEGEIQYAVITRK